MLWYPFPVPMPKSRDAFPSQPPTAFRRVLVASLWIVSVAAAITALALVQPALLRLAVPFVLILVIFWSLSGSLTPPARQIERLADAGRFEDAFRLAIRERALSTLAERFQSGLSVPSPALRSALAATFDELAVLHDAVSDPDNHSIPPSQKRALLQASDESRAAFWNIVRNLAVVARQQIGFRDDHPKIQRVLRLLDHLREAAADARRKLAELTLGATGAEFAAAQEAFDGLRRRGTALLGSADDLDGDEPSA